MTKRYTYGLMSRRDSYNFIGAGYAEQRVPEPTWHAQINAAIGATTSVLNVGAGTGNYEPVGGGAVALEPSVTMLGQRLNPNPAVRGVAEQMPFADNSFDVALAILTVHHWTDFRQGLQEMRRVADRQVIMAFEPLRAHGFWLVDYFRAGVNEPVEANAPSPELIATSLDNVEISIMMVPHDCCDGVAAAYWRRPERYLDPLVQQSISFFALMADDARRSGTERLAADLKSGEWHRRYGHILGDAEADAGYRLVVAQN